MLDCLCLPLDQVQNVIKFHWKFGTAACSGQWDLHCETVQRVAVTSVLMDCISRSRQSMNINQDMPVNKLMAILQINSLLALQCVHFHSAMVTILSALL